MQYPETSKSRKLLAPLSLKGLGINGYCSQKRALYWFAMAASHKVPQAGWLKQQKFISSQFWRLEVQDQGFGRISFILRLLPWLVDDRFLPLSSSGSSLCGS